MKAIYSLALASARTALARGLPENSTQTWARNSYALQLLVPFVSDLDLTLLVERPLASGEQVRLKWILSLLKLCFPFLGETNVYSKEDLELLSTLINPFELERDPRLAALLSEYPGRISPDSSSAIVFLIRMLESDAKNLRTRPARRIRKWTRHFEQVDSGLRRTAPPAGYSFDLRPENPVESILTKVAHLVGHAVKDDREFQEIFRLLDLYIDCIARGVPTDKLAFLLSSHPWLWTLVPHRYCCFEGEIPKMQQHHLKIFARQLEWELFGLLAQRPLLPDPARAWRHLSEIANLVERAKLNNASQDLWNLENSVKRVQDQFR